jgi:long-chain acyl-CoA synthetase
MTQHYATIIDKFCYFELTKPNHLFLAEPVNGVYRQFTWAQAGKEVRSMAASLQALGLGKNDKVAILSKNCAHWIMADLAISMAGCISVPLYPNITPDALREIIVHSESKAIFIGKLDNPKELRTGVPEGLIEITFPFYPNEGCINWDHLVAKEEGIKGKPGIDAGEIACIVYTSGTTGQPKGVMHTFHAMAFAVDAFLKSYPDIHDEKFFSYLPLCHVAERMLVECGTIFTGSTVYFVESMDTFAKNLADTKPTIFLAVPRIWEKLQEGILKKISGEKLNRLLSIPIVASLIRYSIKKKLGLINCHHCFTGASPINASLLIWFKRLGITIQEAYGMTENVALSHANPKGKERFGTVGIPYEGVKVRLGKDNEVQVKSEASMLGYFKEPALTAECFEDGYLKTGDEGSIDENGYLTITGRIKDQFKTSKGKYIMPAPIESKLLETQMVAQVCVVGSGMPSAMVLGTLSERAKNHEKETLKEKLHHLLQVINKGLENHEQLSKIIILPEEWTIANGLLTPTLKIKRKVVDATFGEQYEAWSRSKEPIILI